MRRLIIKVYISFGGHQNQTIERIKDLYDMMYKCMRGRMYVNNLLRKRGLKLYKKIFRIFVDSFLVFYSYKILDNRNQLSTEQ